MNINFVVILSIFLAKKLVLGGASNNNSNSNRFIAVAPNATNFYDEMNATHSSADDQAKPLARHKRFIAFPLGSSFSVSGIYLAFNLRFGI